jgi:hypothetical protein
MSGQYAIAPSLSPVDELSRRLNSSWSNIQSAQTRTERIVQRLSEVIAAIPGPDSDTSVVAHGSVARYECTRGSDLDWTLLVDAQANSDHQDILLEIRRHLKPVNEEGRAFFDNLGLRAPGQEGTFGELAFSQPLVHYIGGEDDSNSNTTRRLLLLLEAIPVSRRREAFDRVRKNILKRYLVEDRGLFHPSVDGESRWIPLFLLNDLARYWRTMAVDFAYKQFNRGNKGYAIRSIKLGTSRKLLFASGLLACFWCDPKISKAADQEPKIQFIIDCLENFFSRTPLERFALFFLAWIPDSDDEFLSECARDLFGAYDEFLGILDDEQKRHHLEMLNPDQENDSEIFKEARRIRHRFRVAIQRTFTDGKSPLRRHSIEKGIF